MNSIKMLRSKILGKAKAFSRNHKTFRKVAKKIYYALKGKTFYISSLLTSVDNKMIYFSTFVGRSYSDTPKAIYEELLQDSRFSDFKFIWVFRDCENYKFLEQNKNTKVVELHSKEEKSALKKSAYWISNYRMFDYYSPKKNQVYVQCWHGVPLKRLGCDIKNSDNAMNSLEEIWAKYHQDTKRFKYLISPAKWTSEKFASAWDLKRFHKEDAIIEEGYPRNDKLINAGKEEIEKIKLLLNLSDIGSKKIILYAPTWRDNQYTNGVGYTYETQVDFERLQRELSDNYIILFRAHYLVANEFDFEKYAGFIYDVSKHDDINDLFLVSDLLITDYSSVFFDFANLKKPIIYYMYDMDYYRDGLRGFYLSLDELPGPIVKEEADLVSSINSMTKNFVIDEKYIAFNNKFNYLNDGKASKRVIDKIFFPI